MSALHQIYQHPLLTEPELEKIFDAHQKVRFKKGDYLLRAGHVAKEYYCIEHGMVRSYVTDYNGNDITTGFSGKNELVVDVFSLFHSSPAKEDIQALSDIDAWKIDFEKFQELYHTFKGFNEWGRAWMSQSLFMIKQRAISMITDSASERYLELLQQRPDLLSHIPLKYIATYLGITDTSLSRIRKELSR